MPGGGEPGERIPVELAAPLGGPPLELGAQQLGEQVVIAVPLAMIVERRQEQVGVLEADQQVGGVAAAGGGVAERAGHPLEDRRLDQEVAHRGLQGIERNLGEVVADVARGSAEAGDGAFAIGLVPQREVRQIEPGGPSLGVLVKRGGGLGRQPQPERVVQEARALVRREREVGLAQLEQFAAGPQRAERERRVDAAGDDDLNVGRLAGQEQLDGPVARPAGDRVVVVEDQHDVALVRCQLVEQPRDDRIDEVLLTEEARRGGERHRWFDRLQGGNDVVPEEHGIVVGVVERNPCQRQLGRPPPLTQQRRLPEPGRRHHQDWSPMRCEPPQQVGALYRARPQPRDAELGAKEHGRGGLTLRPRQLRGSPCHRASLPRRR